MFRKLLRTLHVLAICIFVGSIPGHILIGALADPAQGLESFAIHQQVKYAITATLTGAGIAFTLLTGLLLALSRKQIFKTRWLQVKLLLVAVITLNGAIVLTPLAEQMKEMAIAAVSSRTLSPDFQNAVQYEGVAGAINLVLIILVIALAVFKPRQPDMDRRHDNG